MSKIANEYMDIEYQANREMKERYEETIDEIKVHKEKFKELAKDVNEDWNCWIDISNFEAEEKIEYDDRYKEMIRIYEEIKELEQERDNLKNELVHAKVL